MAQRLDMFEVRPRDRWWPWLEGLSLALLVGMVLGLGGEVVRASYHGYMHAAIGEAVLYDGWRPENPYHAGQALRYYTLYPWLGASLGRLLGIGPLAAFACLNVVGAFFFALAFDALGRAFGLNVLARRFAFGASVLAMNGLGWLGWAWSPPIDHAVPVFAFQSMTWTTTGFGWDARLQGFLPKFLNVSSFGLALAPALAAVACAVAGRSRRAVIGATLFAGTALAINPLAGAMAGLCMAFQLVPRLWGSAARHWLAWTAAGAGACLLALPFLLGAFEPAPQAESLTGTVRFQSSGWMNLLGPAILLLFPATVGWRRWQASRTQKLAWLAGLGVAIVVVAWSRLPWGNEYKLSRWACLWLAVPFGAWAASNTRNRWIAGAVLCASVPSMVLVVGEYLKWGRQGVSPVLRANEVGVLQLPDSEQGRALPEPLAIVLAERPRSDVLWMHMAHPTTRLPQSVVQGNLWAPSVQRALFVDVPQIHNDRIEGLAQRLQWTEQLFAGQSLTASVDALRAAAQSLPDRGLLVLTHAGAAPLSIAALSEVGAERLANENGFELWVYAWTSSD